MQTESIQVKMMKPEAAHGADNHKSARGKTSVPVTVSGLLFWPEHKFIQGKPLEAGVLKTKRSAAEVRTLLAAHREVELSISGHLRGVDGAGSSLDLPEFQRALTQPGARRLADLPSTPTIASAFRTTIRFALNPDPEVIAYIAPDYGITADKPHRIRGNVHLDDQGKTSQTNAPAFVFNNIFGLAGISITCEEISPLALAGGMESSNVFNVALLAAASMLSGADLSLADIFSLAVKLENDEFNGSTGGQGHLCCLLGGAYRHIWLSGLKDSAGRMDNPYGAFSIKLLRDNELQVLEEHLALVQAGKTYQDGKPQVGRTASLINGMWLDLLRDRDPLGLSWHREKLGLTERFTRALPERDFKKAVGTLNRYVEIRDALCLRWLNLALDAHAGKTKAYDGGDLPAYAARYAQSVFEDSNPRYHDCEAIRDCYRRDGEALRKISFYTLSPISELVKEAKEAGIAIMPLGAGGPGANLIALSDRGRDHLVTFFKTKSIPLLTEEQARFVIRGTGALKGFMPFQAGKEPLSIKGFPLLGLRLPQGPAPYLYNQETGEFTAAPFEF